MESLLVSGGPLVLRPVRPADRLLARLFGASLDAALAAGQPPEDSRLLSARASDIVSLPRRRALAGHWAGLLRVARQSARARRPARSAVPVCGNRVLAAEPVIGQLIDCLGVPLPVPARGVAMATVLLTDATGPVYNRHAALDLGSALARSIAELDPAQPLTGATG